MRLRKGGKLLQPKTIFLQTSMKIATYNLRNLFDEGSRQGYGEEEVVTTKEFVETIVGDLARTIREIAPDVLMAQEIGFAPLFERVASEVSDDYKTFVATPDARGIANGVMYKVPATPESIPDIGGFPVMVDGDEDVIGKRLSPYRHFVYLQTEYRNKPLHIFGHHLKASSGVSLKSPTGESVPPSSQRDMGDALARALIYRIAEARKLRELVDKLLEGDPAAQIIILGDFNVTEGSEVLRIIQGSSKYKETQLTNMCESVSAKSRYSYLGGGTKRLLDHILVSPSLKEQVVSIEIKNALLRDQVPFPENTFPESDHAPVVLTLK